MQFKRKPLTWGCSRSTPNEISERSCPQKSFLLSFDGEGFGTVRAPLRWYYAGRCTASCARRARLSAAPMERQDQWAVKAFLDTFPCSSVLQHETDMPAIDRPVLNYSWSKAEISQWLFQTENPINATLDWQESDVSGWVRSGFSGLHDSVMLRDRADVFLNLFSAVSVLGFLLFNSRKELYVVLLRRA